MNTAPALRYTEPARQALNQYFRGRLAPGRLEGADPEELRADLQAHLEEDLLQHGTGTVTVDELRLALARMGEVLLPVKDVADLPGEEVRPIPLKIKRWKWLWVAGFFFPLFTFAFEVVTRGCAGMLFDPLPDAFHYALVLIVPAAAWWFRERILTRGPERDLQGPAALIGAALAVTLYYSLCMVPVSAAAVMATIFFGVGLLAMAPFFAGLAIWSAWRHIKREGDPGAIRMMRWSSLGTMVLILAFGSPALLTRVGIHEAAAADRASDVDARRAAVGFLRSWGSEKELLQACYAAPFAFREGRALRAGPMVWLVDWTQWITPGTPRPDGTLVTTSRGLYWQVTGQPFNQMPRPLQARPWIHSVFNPERDPGSDRDRGGLTVAGRIDGLSLQNGRMDWHCSKASGLCWGEWTFTFSNATSNPEEARCRISLPPGGFVSRVTLWVEGQPQEAAYSTVAKVRSAYENVAVVQRRDPVLVTQPDAGSILLQAFPVPAGGTLKTRLTFTAPAGTDGRVWLPAITEQNFGMTAKVAQALWVQADGGTLEVSPEYAPHSAVENGCPTVTASLPAHAITGHGSSFLWTREAASTPVYCQDTPAGSNPRWMLGTPGPARVFTPATVAWVVDSSASLAPQQEEIRELLGVFPGISSRIFLPGDHPRELQTRDDIQITAADFAGGRDNAPALAAALEWLRDKPGATLVWVHGAQPAAASPHPALEQLLERSIVPIQLFDVPLVPGENGLAGLLSSQPRIRMVPVRLQGEDPVAGLRSALREPVMKFSHLPGDQTPPDHAVRTHDSLARWFARMEAGKLGLKDPAAASALASSYQIVSPWSGAVVLEKLEDYAVNQLTQANAAVSQTIPVIPEPSSMLLMLLSLCPLLSRRRRTS